MINQKRIIASMKGPGTMQSAGVIGRLWELICYPPKMPVRLAQQQLLDEAEKFTLPVFDEYFTGKQLLFNGFNWGNGDIKILLTHGWGSKAADLSSIITRLRELNDVQIIAFDAPGNGSSEGYLSNLILFTDAVKAVIGKYGKPDIVIGHSIGVMANAFALGQSGIKPLLMISIAPLIRLHENFVAIMDNVNTPAAIQHEFFKEFNTMVGRTAASFNLIDLYILPNDVKHWLAYDESDLVAPYDYLKEFLDGRPFIGAHRYENVGHDRILRSAAVMDDMMGAISMHFK